MQEASKPSDQQPLNWRTAFYGAGAAGILVGGGLFDLVVGGLDFHGKDAWQRSRWIGQRFTHHILRGPDSEYLFKGFELLEGITSLCLIDENHLSDFQWWSGEQTAALN